MRISAKTDYAVRVCVELAAQWEPRSGAPALYVKADALSTAQTVSAAFVLGILNELKQSGLVVARRGPDGGFRLARSPDQIVIADIVRAIDGPLADVAGRNVEDVAYSGAAVAVRDVWVALRAAMRSVLDNVTLADVASGDLSADVRALISNDEAWKTRPNRRNK